MCPCIHRDARRARSRAEASVAIPARARQIRAALVWLIVSSGVQHREHMYQSAVSKIYRYLASARSNL